jgi:hypothetical protein
MKRISVIVFALRNIHPTALIAPLIPNRNPRALFASSEKGINNQTETSSPAKLEPNKITNHKVKWLDNCPKEIQLA